MNHRRLASQKSQLEFAHRDDTGGSTLRVGVGSWTSTRTEATSRLSRVRELIVRRQDKLCTFVSQIYSTRPASLPSPSLLQPATAAAAAATT